MATQQKDFEYTQTIKVETRVALLEQSVSHISTLLHDIKNEIQGMRLESKEERIRIWKKLDALDQRINDNYKYLDQKINSNFKWLIGIIIPAFGGLYIMALGPQIKNLFHPFSPTSIIEIQK